MYALLTLSCTKTFNSGSPCEAQLEHIKDSAEKNSLLCALLRRKKSSFETKEIAQMQRKFNRRVSIYRECQAWQCSGVIINDQMTASHQVSCLMTSCLRQPYAMWALQCHRIPAESMEGAFKSAVLAKISTVHPHGSVCQRLDKFLWRFQRLGLAFLTVLNRALMMWNQWHKCSIETFNV